MSVKVAEPAKKYRGIISRRAAHAAYVATRTFCGHSAAQVRRSEGVSDTSLMYLRHAASRVGRDWDDAFGFMILGHLTWAAFGGVRERLVGARFGALTGDPARAFALGGAVVQELRRGRS